MNSHLERPESFRATPMVANPFSYKKKENSLISSRSIRFCGIFIASTIPSGIRITKGILGTPLLFFHNSTFRDEFHYEPNQPFPVQAIRCPASGGVRRSSMQRDWRGAQPVLGWGSSKVGQPGGCANDGFSSSRCHWSGLFAM